MTAFHISLWKKPMRGERKLLNSHKCRTSSGSRLGFSSTLIYASKGDVYLNGDPAHPGAASLPDGSYYVQVTDPSGACILGTSLGSGNETPFVVTGGVANCIKLCEVLINTGLDLRALAAESLT
jgi:hypothetical protein